jgi:hypothetical protein
VHLDCIATTFEVKMIFRPNIGFTNMNVGAVDGTSYGGKTTKFLEVSHDSLEMITFREGYLMSEFPVYSIDDIA